jgi:hypothetical protein
MDIQEHQNMPWNLFVESHLVLSSCYCLLYMYGVSGSSSGSNYAQLINFSCLNCLLLGWMVFLFMSLVDASEG